MSVFRLLFCANVVLTLLACSGQKFTLPPAQQEFAQTITYNNKVDFIFMIDNSSNMAVYQQRLADQVPELMQKMNSLALDYHIGVVTSDMRTGGSGGRLLGQGRFITAGTPNQVAILQSLVNQGQAGSDLERGIESIYQVLQPSYLNHDGLGFLRPDSLLVLIFLSNEDDYSTISLANMKAFLDQLRPIDKHGQKTWIANFLGILNIDGDCKSTPYYIEAGLRYMDLADASGGLKATICHTSFGQAIQNIHARIAEVLTDYYLVRRPVVESITVIVDGVEIPKDNQNGWTYEAEGNFIRFHGTAIPKSDVRIVIDFQPAEAT